MPITAIQEATIDVNINSTNIILVLRIHSSPVAVTPRFERLNV